jgi:hypothetical protein
MDSEARVSGSTTRGVKVHHVSESTARAWKHNTLCGSTTRDDGSTARAWKRST